MSSGRWNYWAGLAMLELRCERCGRRFDRVAKRECETWTNTTWLEVECHGVRAEACIDGHMAAMLGDVHAYINQKVNEAMRVTTALAETRKVMDGIAMTPARSWIRTAAAFAILLICAAMAIAGLWLVAAQQT